MKNLLIRILFVIEVVIFFIILSPFLVIMSITWLSGNGWKLPFKIYKNNPLDKWSTNLEKRRKKL
jgi:hypothetical protein